jgi:hypothetical protein
MHNPEKQKQLEYALVDTEAMHMGHKRPLGYAKHINQRAQELKEYFSSLPEVKRQAGLTNNE